MLQDGVKSNYAYFPVVVHPEVLDKTREDIISALSENNIGARRYFYPLTSTIESFEGKYDVNDTPVALKVSENVMCLPLYEQLDVKTVDRICDIILKIAR